eukprot:8922613-Pyramimonas_sp.AAC.1
MISTGERVRQECCCTSVRGNGFALTNVGEPSLLNHRKVLRARWIHREEEEEEEEEEEDMGTET